MVLTRWRKTARDHAPVTALVIVLVFVAVLVAPTLFSSPTDFTGGTGSFDTTFLISGLPWQIGLSVTLACIVWALNWWDITQFFRRSAPEVNTSLIATSAFPVFGIVAFSLMIDQPAGGYTTFELLALILTLNFFVGFAEEVLFRGILFGGLRAKYRLGTAIVVSSCIFGLVHWANLSLGQGKTETIFQVINATALGMLFCALVLLGRSLWPAVFLHMVWNTNAMMAIAASDAPAIAEDGSTTEPILSLSSYLLPGIILLLACASLWKYRSTSGHRFRAVIPVSGPHPKTQDL